MKYRMMQKTSLTLSHYELQTERGAQRENVASAVVQAV